jgi:hypothetical protein
MVFQLEIPWHHRTKLPDTTLDIVYPIARPASEMVMVHLARRFVPRGLGRQLHRQESTITLQILECPIDRRDAQTTHCPGCGRMNLLNAQRTTGISDNLPDRTALTSILFHRPTTSLDCC